MRISIVITEGVKQIMMTPETEHEKQALGMIAPTDVLRCVARKGTFAYDTLLEHAHFQVAECQGDYLRLFDSRESLMFVIKDEPRGEK